MKISYNVTGSKRKELVQAISRELETEAKYCGAPGFAYEVGGLRIDRDGMVSGPDNRGLIADLEGLYSLIPAAAAYDTAGVSATTSDESDLEPRYTEEELGLGLHRRDPIGEDGMQADDVPETVGEPDETAGAEDESYGLTVSLPREGCSSEALDNLKRLIASKASLIKKALGLTELPVEVDEKVISFPWYNVKPSPEAINATSHLIGKLAAFAKLHRVNSKHDEQVENEKFAFRCFLIRLGFVGSEYKQIRATLLKNMTGNGAFKDSQRHTGPRPAKPLDLLTDVQASESEDASNA